VRVLVACEFSGVVRDAFRARGHSAISCDILPCERGPEHHLQMDIMQALATAGRSLGDGWEPDLMIAHPPCQYLCNSGVRWLYGGKGTERDVTRWLKMIEAAQFFKALLNASVPRIAIENPIMHRHAQKIVDRRHDQIVQPYQFGHPETKATCLWLKNLPPLRTTNLVGGRNPRVHFASPHPDRWKERSRTLQGFAEAMADQWGSLEQEKAA
jgi:hypothetical protein